MRRIVAARACTDIGDNPAVRLSSTFSATPSPSPLARLVSLRWLSVLAIAALGVLAGPLLAIAVPTGHLLAVAAALALWNLLTCRMAGQGPWHTLLDLTVDVSAWTAALYLTGGATNPLISLLLPLIAVGAAALPTLHAWGAAGLAVIAYSWLWTHHLPLGLAEPSRAVAWHLAGMWATFVLSAAVVTWYVTRTTGAVRARDRALAEARERRLRDERVLAMANLAAGAAHELGTPLATMKLLVDNLRRPALAEAERCEDLALMATQIDDCKAILGKLAAAAGRPRAEAGRRRAVGEWLREIAGTLRRRRPALAIRLPDAPADAHVVVDAALDHAVQNLINNAATAGPAAPVEVMVERRGAMLDLSIADRGPGLPAEVLDTMRAPGARRPLATEGMGVGLLLSVSAIEQCGGSLEYTSRPGGGTIARVTLPIAAP